MALGRRKREESSGTDRPSNAIVAAAQRLNRSASAFGTARIPTQSWQTEAWRQYEISGELKFAATWMANSLSRCRLVVGEVDEHGVVTKVTDNEQVLAITKGLTGSPTQQAKFLRKAAVQLFVPGDCYLIGEPGPLGNFVKFYTVSIDEISAVGRDKVMIDTGDGMPFTLNTDSTLVIRMWHEHARKCWEADSPVRSALPTLREIEQYGRYINAVIDSRLAGAGIMGVPTEMNFPSPPEGLQPGETAFMSYLTKAMMEPIHDPSSPSAVVPIVIEAPADALEKIVWIVNPQGDLTEVPAQLRTDARGALSVALDLPADVIQGRSSANHWGQWALEEQAIKIHIEPLLILIASALTEGFLTPALEAAGIDTAKYVFWFDSTDLVLRPDRGQDAKDNYDRGTISGDSLNRETGFTELDKPTGEEEAIRNILKLVALSPTAADVMLPALAKLYGLEKYGIDAALFAPPAPDPGGTPPQEKAPDPNSSERDLPTQQPRQAPNAPTQNPGPAVVSSGGFASEGMVISQSILIDVTIRNALTRAGAMLSGRKADLKDVPKHEVHVVLGGISAEDAHRVLAGQFDYLAEITDPYQAEAARLQAYALLTTGQSHG